jgi:hypothetical protein
MRVDSNEVDAEFLAWVAAHSHDCGHNVMAEALRDTEHLVRRPRRLRAEFSRTWIRAVVRAEMETSGKKDAAVVAARDYLGAGERTVWAALAPPPAAPPLNKERFLKIVADNLEIAERSGNQAAARLLRRITPGTVAF